MNKQRERLVELLNKKYDHFCDQCGVNKDSHYTDNLADYLLADGWMRPPCKVGEILYIIEAGSINECKVIECKYSSNSNNGVHWHIVFDGLFLKSEAHIGVDLFLTKEEALSKLQASCKQVKGGVDNGNNTTSN